MVDNMFDKMEKVMNDKNDEGIEMEEQEVEKEQLEEKKVPEQKEEKRVKKVKVAKPTEADLIEANNLLEEVSEILEPCIKCGMCKSICPVFKILREEPATPRGKVTLLSDKTLDKILFECNLCRGCEQKCPLGIKVCEAIRKGREAMVLKGNELKSNEEMMKNVRECGNPFGKGEINPEKLYCC